MVFSKHTKKRVSLHSSKSHCALTITKLLERRLASVGAMILSLLRVCTFIGQPIRKGVESLGTGLEGAYLSEGNFGIADLFKALVKTNRVRLARKLALKYRGV